MAQTPSVKFLDDLLSLSSAKPSEKMTGSPSKVLEFSSKKGEVFNISPRKGEYFKHASASKERLETLSKRTKSKTQKSKSDASKQHCTCKSHDLKCACVCMDDASLSSTPKPQKPKVDQRTADYERMKMLTDVNAVLSVVLSTVMVLARRIDTANMKDHLTWTLRFLENVKDDQGQAPNNIKVIMKLIEDCKKQEQAANEEDKNKKK